MIRNMAAKLAQVKTEQCVYVSTISSNDGLLPVQHQAFNSSPPSAAYMRQWTGSALVQVVACHVFGAKPLPEPMLAYCQLVCWEQISVKFESEFSHFHSRKCIWNYHLPIYQPFCPGGWVNSWANAVLLSNQPSGTNLSEQSSFQEIENVISIMAAILSMPPCVQWEARAEKDWCWSSPSWFLELNKKWGSPCSPSPWGTESLRDLVKSQNLKHDGLNIHAL